MRRAHSFSPWTMDALQVLGLEIARGRRARRMTQGELAERAGISKNTLRSVEQGAPTVAAGIYFELAALVGLNLFEGDGDLRDAVARSRDKLTLLPSRVRPRPTEEINDDF